MSALFTFPPLVAVVIVGIGVLFVAGIRMARADAAERLAVQDLVLLREEQRKEARGLGPVSRLAARLVPRLRRALGPAVITKVQKRIDEAGRPDGLTVDILLRRMLTLALLLVLPLAVVAVMGNPFIAVLGLVLPVVMPLGALAAAQRKRTETIDRDLPDFLDVLAVTVTAGVAFRPALARVSERFEGPLAEEVLLTLGQMGNGASLRTAFNQLRSRTPSESMSQFVTALLQSEELGAPLAQTLNQIADDMRRTSAQQMRRRAARAAPRVTLVTSLVLVPGVILTLLVGFLLGSGISFENVLG